MLNEAVPVFEGSQLRASCFWPDRPRLLVRFDNWVKNKQGFEQPKRWKAIENTDCALLNIQTASNDWGLNKDLPDMCVALTKFATGYQKRTALGFSMGGYMALRLAHVLCLNKVVLVSPQYSILSSRVPFETRYKEDEGRLNPKFDTFDLDYAPEVQGVLLYDPTNKLDRAHKDLIVCDFPDVTPVPLTLGGHPATKIIHQGGAWASFVNSVTSLGSEPKKFRTMHKKARVKSQIYSTRLAAYNQAKADRSVTRPDQGPPQTRLH